jgi:hypothetical protein
MSKGFASLRRKAIDSKAAVAANRTDMEAGAGSFAPDWSGSPSAADRARSQDDQSGPP